MNPLNLLSTPPPAMRKDVCIYATVLVKVAGVEGDTDAECISRALASTDLDRLFNRELSGNEDRLQAGSHTLVRTQYADEVVGFLVDHIDPTSGAIIQGESYGPDGENRQALDPQVRVIVSINKGEVVDAVASHQNVDLTFVEYSDDEIERHLAVRIPSRDGSPDEEAVIHETQVVACDPAWIQRFMHAWEESWEDANQSCEEGT